MLKSIFSIITQTNTPPILDKAHIEEAMRPVYDRTDKIMVGFVGLHFLLALMFIPFYQTWLTSLTVSSLAFGSFLLVVRWYPCSFFTRAWTGVVLQGFVLLYIFQLKGLSELRFFFFTSFVILIAYQDWRAMLPSFGIFFGQMLIFAYLGYYVEVFPVFAKDYHEFILRFIPRLAGTTVIDSQALWFYLCVSCLQVGLAGVWAYTLRLHTLKEAYHEKKLLQKQTEIETVKNSLEESVKHQTFNLQQALEDAQSSEEELRQNIEELQATQDEVQMQRQKLLENQAEMLKVEAELRERQRLMERSQWLESNLATFDDLMRQYYDKSIREFSEVIMLKLAELLNATQGAFYIYDGRQDVLLMTAGYACTPETVKKNTFRAGEGIIGQIAKTKKTVYFQDLPTDSITVDSALTKVRSKTLLLVPMLYNEHIQGVIEIGILKELDSLYLEFLERLAYNIATMLQSMQGFLQTQRLLAQSQEITKQLEEKADELEKIRQEAESKAQELRSQFEAINHALIVFEYTPEGNILTVNDNFEALSGYKRADLVGKHHSHFLAERYIHSEEYRQVWHRIKNNDFVESECECIAKNATTFWLHTSYYAIGEGRNKKIRVLAHDATREKEQERKIFEQIKILKENEELMLQQVEAMQQLQEEVEQKNTQLQDQLNALNLSTALVEYDQHGKVIFANERFYEIMGFEYPELTGMYHQTLVEQRFAESKSYQKFWDRLHAKDFIDGEFEFVSKKGEIIWLRGNYYPVTDKRGKLLKIMQLSTDITQEMEQDERLKNHLLELETLRSQLTEKNRALEARISYLEGSL